MNIRAQMWLLSKVARHMPIGKEGRREVVHSIREKESEEVVKMAATESPSSLRRCHRLALTR